MAENIFLSGKSTHSYLSRYHPPGFAAVTCVRNRNFNGRIQRLEKGISNSRKFGTGVMYIFISYLSVKRAGGRISTGG